MTIRITKKDGVLILSASLSILAMAVVGWSVIGEAALVILLTLSTMLMLFGLVEVYRRLTNRLSEVNEELQNGLRTQDWRRNQDYRQIESLLSLFFTIRPEFPLPDTRDWGASPDLLKKIVEIILLEKPAFTVEASSGVSTFVIAYCLKKVGRGKVVSLEHDAKYATISQNLISLHGLEEIATIVHAPLKEVEINGQKWLWYSTDCLSIDQPIDLLVVDGPPGNIQKLSRYPALPLLYRYLDHESNIILDDGRREDERNIVALWQREFSHITSDFLDNEKGAFVIHRNVRPASDVRMQDGPQRGAQARANKLIK